MSKSTSQTIFAARSYV